jgi:hypothetical protein
MSTYGNAYRIETLMSWISFIKEEGKNKKRKPLFDEVKRKK